jgi:hypothetical protein
MPGDDILRFAGWLVTEGPAAAVPAVVVLCLWTKEPVCVERVSIVAVFRSSSILVEELTNIIYET